MNSGTEGAKKAPNPDLAVGCGSVCAVTGPSPRVHALYVAQSHGKWSNAEGGGRRAPQASGPASV